MVLPPPAVLFQSGTNYPHVDQIRNNSVAATPKQTRLRQCVFLRFLSFFSRFISFFYRTKKHDYVSFSEMETSLLLYVRRLVRTTQLSLRGPGGDSSTGCVLRGDTSDNSLVVTINAQLSFRRIHFISNSVDYVSRHCDQHVPIMKLKPKGVFLQCKILIDHRGSSSANCSCAWTQLY